MPEVSIERLRALEWNGALLACTQVCPVCGGNSQIGHYDGCWLAELLRATAFAVKGAG